MVYRRYQKAIPDVVKKIRTMILKTNPDNKLDIVNKLGLSIVTINHVIKHPLICRVAKKPNVHHLTQTKVEQDCPRTVCHNLHNSYSLCDKCNAGYYFFYRPNHRSTRFNKAIYLFNSFWYQKYCTFIPSEYSFIIYGISVQ